MGGASKSDAPPNSLMDSTTSPKVKTLEGKIIGARSLACNTSGVEAVLEFQNGTRMSDKRVNYSSGLAQTKQQVG